MQLAQVQQFGIRIRYGLEILHQYAKRVIPIVLSDYELSKNVLGPAAEHSLPTKEEMNHAY